MAVAKNESGIWSRRPAEDDMVLRYELLRVPPKGLANVLITSHDMIGAKIHFWNSRSKPCTGATCVACENNQRARWTGWIMIYSPRSQGQYILEITAAGAEAIDRFFRNHRTLRGAKLQASRRPEKPNGRLCIQLEKPAAVPAELPKALDLQPLLMKMWGVQEADLNPVSLVMEDLRAYEENAAKDLARKKA